MLTTGRPFVAPSRRRQLDDEPQRACPGVNCCYSSGAIMQDDVTNAFDRIDRALARIERVAFTPPTPVPIEDTRYERLRMRTQAALAELDTVIARVGGRDAS